MNTIALDLSLCNCGYIILDKDGAILTFGCIRSKKEGSKVSESDTHRIANLVNELKNLILTYNVSLAYFEDPAGSKSSTANKALSLVKGAALGLLIALNIEYKYIRAKQAKKALCGDSDSDKLLVFNSVSKYYKDFPTLMKSKPKYLWEAVSDSLAIYITISQNLI